VELDVDYCKDRHKYYLFRNFDVQFILQDDNKRVENEPAVRFKKLSKDGDPERFRVTIPRGEQFKLPSNREIQMVINAKWIYPEFDDVIDTDSQTFQTLVNTLKFSQAGKDLIPYFFVG